jgi:mRNA interferase MazF
MMTYNVGTIVLVDFPHTDGAKGKPRPVAIVLDSGDADIMVAPITSQPRQSAYDFPLADWAASGLKLPSTVRIRKLVTIKKTKVRHTLGSLSPTDRKTVAAGLSSLFQGW